MASKTRIFFLNALALTLTALFMRGIGVAFNVYVSNRAGSEAMGLYSLLGGVYGFSITLATAGINLGTTRLVSGAMGLGDGELAKRSVRRALLVCTLTGTVATALLLILSPAIAVGILGDARAIRPLRFLSLSLLPAAICSCLSGYFTAVRRVKCNASLQIVIQFFKIGITALLLSYAVERGTESACIALVLGSVATEFLSFLLTYSLYRFDLKKITSVCGTISDQSNRNITRRLLGITLPVTFSACIRSALTMIQHALIPRGLLASGQSWERALSSYGALHGMALPIVLFPSAIIIAFSGLLIPEVSECCVTKQSTRLRRVSYRTLSLSLMFSIGVAGIMFLFSEELGQLIYHNAETARYIRIMAPLIPVMYIDSAVDAILKGSGHQVYSMNVNIADALTSCILVFLLTPRLGIWGYIISIYATEILNTSLSLCKMFSVSKMRPKVFHQVIMPLLCVIGATNASKIVLSLIPRAFPDAVGLVLHILLTVVLYITLLVLTKTVGAEEREFLSASLLPQAAYDRKFRASI